ncbi:MULTISPECIES: SRPBCC family protein [Nocardia]|uniref:SRPBCC family protein n=1 Tax=Nocardia ignorata TaxID=145285 RepID=UPI00362D5849
MEQPIPTITWPTTAWGVSIAAIVAGVCLLGRSQRYAMWGATSQEATAAMPGDDLLADAGLQTTRAVTIDAPPAAVWPWLVQMGPGRAGAYTFDWIENLLGLDMHSSHEIVPAYQHLAVGDELTLGDSGPTMRAQIIEPPHTLVWASDEGDWTWTFLLTPVAGGTRLISRNRLTGPSSRLLRRLYAVVMVPASLVMERKMLRGIKQRAEAPTDVVAEHRR